MNFADVIILGLIAGILGLCAWYIWREKKKGKQCIGCPDSCACSRQNCAGGCSGCGD